MPPLTAYSVKLADEIARQLGKLTYDLHQLPAEQAMEVTARLLAPETGALARVTSLMVTGSVRAKDLAERGLLPAEVCLALGRAANELDDIALDLGEHADALATAGSPPAPAATPPAPAALVVRRHR
ncbi:MULTISPECIES: hypothetical protein [unclassified Streptomyces]|uniref:hypothetical protein n=1 Tax=unclassified Streptomyces TaxID=2593676 RepID=UPI0036415F7A